MHFEAFALVRADGVDFENSRKGQFEWLKGQGFEVVHYEEGGRCEPACVGGRVRKGSGRKRHSLRRPGAAL